MVKLSIGNADPARAKADLLAVCVYQGETDVLGVSGAARKSLGNLLSKNPFSGQQGKVLVVPSPPRYSSSRILFIGLGQRGVRSPEECARRAGGTALKRCAENGVKRVAIVPPGESAEVVVATGEGALLADYSFDVHKHATKSTAREHATHVSVLAEGPARSTARKGAKLAERIVQGVALARDLGNEPSNVLTPERMAEVAQELAKERAADGLKCKILGKKEIERLGMGAYLAVNQGSRDEPRLIHLSYKPEERRRGGLKQVAVVGKGLTFDTGGISIKPSAGMEDMKFDMCGAGAVLGLFRCLPDLGLDFNVDGIVAATDNMPGGAAIKPGDIVTSMSGRTIEIINTDAEGRLTLVDAITYALKLKPDYVVDLATLTGACAIALGAATGVMSNDADLARALVASGDATGERSWHLPLYRDYRTQIRSDYADVKNVGERYGGALTAGLFIQEWVPEGLPWAHMDIAGSAWTHAELPTCGKGATGIGVRTLAHWLRGL